MTGLFEAGILRRREAGCSSVLSLGPLLLFLGCGPHPGSASPRSDTSGATLIVRPAGSRIEPGASLSRLDFVKTLAATGADFVVVTVVQAHCGPCITESLELVARRPLWRRRHVEVIGLGMDPTVEGVKTFFRQTGSRVDFPLYSAPWFAEEKGVGGSPALFIFDATGTELFRAEGPDSGDLPALADARLAALANEKASRRK